MTLLTLALLSVVFVFVLICPGLLRGWPGPDTRNNSKPPSSQIQFFHAQILRYRDFQCILGRWIIV